MNAKYKELGFKQPDYIENKYGIKIYLGTKGKDDWCIEIPKELSQVKDPEFAHWNNQDMGLYCATEKEVLELAEKYTRIAKSERRRK